MFPEPPTDEMRQEFSTFQGLRTNFVEDNISTVQDDSEELPPCITHVTVHSRVQAPIRIKCLAALTRGKAQGLYEPWEQLCRRIKP